MRDVLLVLVFAAIFPANAQEEVWLRPPVPPDMTPEQLNQAQQNKNQRDVIDARIAEYREAAAIIRLAETDFAKKEWARVVQRLQRVLNLPANGLIRSGQGQFVSVRTQANRLLARMPAAWLKRYQQQFGAAADRSLEDALSRNDFIAVGDLATRHLHTEAGLRAVKALMLRHFDRGEYSLVLSWNEVLADRPGRPQGTQQLLTVLARRRLGITSDSLPDSFEVGGKTIAKALVLKQNAHPSRVERTQDKWPQFLGSADRRARAVDRFPMMVETWVQPILQREPIIDLLKQITTIVFDMADSVVPAAVPIVVGDKIACRTLSGVEVFDAASGTPLWRTRAEASTRALLATRVISRSYSVQLSTRSRQSLTNFLFRDSVHGHLSSDGHRLYVIEQQALADVSAIRSAFRSSRAPVSPQYSTNVLTAYNLETGRIEWSIGGPDSVETFKPALAGTYFHGVPAVLGDELYIVGEKDNAISLHVLDAGTGEENWKQLLAYTETPIERDLARRQWAASVTSVDGVLLCPTTVDWLFAVDPLTRSILWLNRIKPPVVQTSRSAFLPAAAPILGTQWGASAPIVVGDRVVYTPLEAANLFAIDLVSGKRIWSQPKVDFCYLAGAHDGKAIVVGTNQVVALDVAGEGAVVWTFRFSNDRPSGRGVMSQQYLHQPLASGQVVSIDLNTGKLAKRTGGNSGRDRLLANLVLHKNGFVLQTPSTLEAYELRPEKDEPKPTSPAGQLRMAEILLADSRFSDSIKAADEIDESHLSADQKQLRNKLLKRAITVRIREQPESAESDIQRLSTLVDDPDLIMQFQIDTQLRTGNAKDAFRKLIELYKSDGSMFSEYRYRVARDAWLAGRLQSVWEKMDDASRADMKEEITGLSSDEGGLDRLTRLLAFHPTALATYRDQLKTELSEKQFSRAERTLQTLRMHNSEFSEESAFDMAKALAGSGHDLDAVALLEKYRLSERKAELGEFESKELKLWAAKKWTVRQFQPSDAANFMRGIDTYRPGSSFHRDFICLSDGTAANYESQRLNFFSKQTGRLFWSTLLQGGNEVSTVYPNGQAMLIQHGPHLTCVAPLTKEVLWAMPLPSRSVQLNRPFRSLRNIANPARPVSASGRRTPVALVNGNYFCIRSRGSISVHDSLSGEFRWSRSDVPAATSVLGTSRAVFLLEDEKVRICRAIDGSLIDDVDLEIQDTQVYGAIDQHLILIETDDDEASLRLYDPLTRSTAWRRVLPADSRIAFLSETEMLLLSNGSDLEFINLVTGEVTALQNEHGFGEAKILAAVTLDRIVVGSLKTTSELILQSTSQKLDDSLQTFSKQTGERLWGTEVENPVAVMLSHFRSLPLMMLGRNDQKVSDRVRARDYELRNALTGKTLATRTVPSVFDHGYPSLRLDPTGFIELSTTRGGRFRFSPMPGQNQ